MQTYTNKNMPPENSNIHNGHAYVDLGLPSGLLWATCNIGASSPEEYGDYFAWGETKPKEEYNWKTYKFPINGCDVDKYTSFGMELEDIDDAAHVNWGGNWRMPTTEEQTELCEHCEWTWTDNYKGTEINGYIVKSKTNGNTIFLPAAGVRWDYEIDYAGYGGLYWSRSFGATSYVEIALHLKFAASNVYPAAECRYYGQSVRAVCPCA